ncbi:GpE family phage tail protein [Paracandidimonas soli]|uniref:GpE protein n=1 Tax=Paracandidimonas soli TaxID=1917182 RepID=A0A4R3VAD0_9BURK|nr:GpE family phage tail protein [Paracandidimonas soli]TCV00524.1 GpE protein [Paracandidimonas soli]
MADLAIVFHWTPSDMADMPLAELMDWRERARVRVEPDS